MGAIINGGITQLEILKENPAAFVTRLYEAMDLDVGAPAQRIEETNFDPDSLRLDKYKMKKPGTIADIEAISAEALIRFGYQ